MQEKQCSAIYIYLVRNIDMYFWDRFLKLVIGPDNMTNFSPAFEANALKIKLAITRRGIQPGLKSQGEWAEKSRLLPLRSRSDFSGIKAVK